MKHQSYSLLLRFFYYRDTKYYQWELLQCQILNNSLWMFCYITYNKETHTLIISVITTIDYLLSLKNIFKISQYNVFAINPEKCAWNIHEKEFLGHRLNSTGLKLLNVYFKLNPSDTYFKNSKTF